MNDVLNNMAALTITIEKRPAGPVALFEGGRYGPTFCSGAEAHGGLDRIRAHARGYWAASGRTEAEADAAVDAALKPAPKAPKGPRRSRA